MTSGLAKIIEPFPNKTLCRSTNDYWYDCYINYHVWCPTLTPYIPWAKDTESQESVSSVYVNEEKPTFEASMKTQNWFDLPFDGQLFKNIYEDDSDANKVKAGHNFDFYMKDGWPFVNITFSTKAQSRQ